MPTHQSPTAFLAPVSRLRQSLGELTCEHVTSVLVSGTIVPQVSTTSSVDPSTRDPSTILFGRTRRRVLAWLFGHPQERFYLRQIVRQSGAAHGAVQRELQMLVEAGILRRTVEGRHVYFQANRESPIFAELKALLLKTAGLVDVIREALAPIADRVHAAFVFGSAARGELRSNSDVDVLVVGDVSFPAVADALAGAQTRLGRDVNPTVYPPAEFRKKIRARHHFLTTVLQEPRLFALGGPDELARLGAERLAPKPQVKPKRGSGPSRRRRAGSSRQRR
jgi:predicted nucleotidyltransferase